MATNHNDNSICGKSMSTRSYLILSLLNKYGSLWQTAFSNTYSWKKICSFWFKLHWFFFLFRMTHPADVEYGFGNGLLINRQWTTAQTSGEEFHWCQNAPLGWHWVKYWIPPGAHFTNDFSIVIQIQCEFITVSTQIWMQWSLKNFAHAILSLFVQR